MERHNSDYLSKGIDQSSCGLADRRFAFQRKARAMHRCETQCGAKAMHDKDRPSTEMARHGVVLLWNGQGKAIYSVAMAKQRYSEK